jgi:hypothetical protein
MSDAIDHRRKKLGDILEDCHVVSHAQVQAALAEQRRTGKLFGEALIDLGFVSEDDLGWALSAQLNLPYIDLSPDMVDRTVLKSLDPELMRKYKVLPLVRVGDALTVAVADPTNREAIRAIEQATRLTLQVSIASPRRVNRIIADLLGPERNDAPDSSDLLFREITRPTVSEDDAVSPRPNPLGYLVARALKERVREIHMDPAGDIVRVRFRRGVKLDEEPAIAPEDYRGMVTRLRRTFGEGILPLDPVRAASTVAFSEASLRVALTLLPGEAGESLILELDETRGAEADLSSLFEEEESAHAVRGWLANAGGFLVVTGPPNAAVRTVWQGLLRASDRTHRRVALVGPDAAAHVDGVMLLRDSYPDSPVPGQGPFDPIEARGLDVLFTGSLKDEATLDRLLMAAACGRLIVARVLAPDATAALALVREACRARSVLSRALLGIIEADLDASGRPRAALMELNDPLRRALDGGAHPRELAQAAATGGYRALAARLTHSGAHGGRAAA